MDFKEEYEINEDTLGKYIYHSYKDALVRIKGHNSSLEVIATLNSAFEFLNKNNPLNDKEKKDNEINLKYIEFLKMYSNLAKIFANTVDLDDFEFSRDVYKVLDAHGIHDTDRLNTLIENSEELKDLEDRLHNIVKTL